MKLINFFFLFFLILSNNSYSKEILIKFKVHDAIITNLDIENEKKYLILLNANLKKLSPNDLESLASNSLIREIIKTTRVKEVFDISKEYNFVNSVEKNFYQKLGMQSLSEFKSLIKSKELNYKLIRNKLKTETLWNKLIYDKYKNSIKVDENILKKKILETKANSKKKYEYNLYEILIELNENETLSKKLEKIKRSVEKNGFENTANLYSISESSNFGGELGWIKETQLSNKIIKKLKKIDKNEISDPINIPGGFLLLKYTEKKEIISKIDINKEVEALKTYETNRQLNQFSIIYYKRLKQNININEVE